MLLLVIPSPPNKTWRVFEDLEIDLLFSRAASPCCSCFFHNKSNHRQLPRCLFVFDTLRWWDRTLQRARRNWILTRQFHMLIMNIMFGFSMLNTIEGQCMSIHEYQWLLKWYHFLMSFFEHLFIFTVDFSLQVDALSCQFYSHTSLIWVHDTGFFDVNVHVARASNKHTLKITKEWSQRLITAHQGGCDFCAFCYLPHDCLLGVELWVQLAPYVCNEHRKGWTLCIPLKQKNIQAMPAIFLGQMQVLYYRFYQSFCYLLSQVTSRSGNPTENLLLLPFIQQKHLLHLKKWSCTSSMHNKYIQGISHA